MTTKMVARLAVPLLATLVVALLPAAPLARGADASSDAPAGARLTACHRSPDIDQRLVAVGTSMRPLPGAGHLAVKLDLWERSRGQRWALRSDVPGLGAWVTPSDAGVGSRAGDVFKYRQSVGRLEVPAAYRFHVAFRWLDDDGNVVREASRTTAVCRQPDVRPDLVLRSVTAAASTRSPGLVQYSVLVGNEGRSAVPRATVIATFPDTAGPTQHRRTVRRLAAGQTAVITFTGPGCAAGEQPASFVVDPANAVDEADEANNGLSAVCPAP